MDVFLDVVVPVIPQCARTWSPLEADLDVNIFLEDIKQVAQNEITLCLVQPHNPLSHGSIHPKSFPTGGRMNSHKRMGSFNVFRTSHWVVTIKIRVS